MAKLPNGKLVKLKESEKTRKLKISYSALHRHRREISMFSPYRVPPSTNTHTRNENTSNHTEHNLKMISNSLKMISKDSNETGEKNKNKKNNLGGGDPNKNPTQGRDLIE